MDSHICTCKLEVTGFAPTQLFYLTTLSYLAVLHVAVYLNDHIFNCQADYRGNGKEELMHCSVDREVLGYLATTAD